MIQRRSHWRHWPRRVTCRSHRRRCPTARDTRCPPRRDPGHDYGTRQQFLHAVVTLRAPVDLAGRRDLTHGDLRDYVRAEASRVWPEGRETPEMTKAEVFAYLTGRTPEL